jgi:hypothetical protein
MIQIAIAVRKRILESRNPAFFEKALTWSSDAVFHATNDGLVSIPNDEGTLVVNGIHKCVIFKVNVACIVKS